MATRLGLVPPARAIRYISSVVRLTIEPFPAMEKRQRRRVRLLSAYLLFFTIVLLIGAITLQHSGNKIWISMAATTIVCMISYVLSRTRFYRPTILVAVVLPAFPVFNAMLFMTDQRNAHMQLMWMALPLLISTILLPMRRTIIVAASYILAIVALTFIVDASILSMVESLAFITMIAFFAIVISVILQNDQSETDNELAQRKQIEEALRESEVKFSTAFHASPNAMSITTLKDGLFLEVNDGFLRDNGFTHEEVIGHNALELKIWAKSADRDKVLGILRKEGRVKNAEFSSRKKTGEIRTMLFSAEPITISGEPCIISMTTDITERKMMESALRESEEKFSKAFSSSPDVISILNLRDRRFIDINDSFTRYTGYTREEVIGHTPAQINIWANPEERKRVLAILNEKGRVRNKEIHTLTKSGDIRIGLYSAEKINIGGETCSITVIADITESKQAEEALRESEEKFSKAFHLSPVMITINTLEQDGIFIDVSDSFTRITGYSREEAIGRSSIELGIWARREDNDRMLSIMKKHGRVYNEEYLFRMKSGEISVWLFSAELINIGGEKCVICVTTDINERKRMEEALKESEEKFSKAFNSSPDAVAITTLKDGRFVEINDSYTRINGYTREEVIGHSSAEFGAWSKKEERNKILQILKEQGRVNNEEVHLKTKSGDVNICLFSAELINIGGEPCMISLATDITRRKQAEEELKKALSNLERSSTQLATTNKELEAFSYSVSHDLRSPLRSIDGFSQALLEDYMDKLDEAGQDYLRRLRGASQKMGELIDGLLKLSRLTRSEMHLEKVDLSALAKEITIRLRETQPERHVDFTIGRGLTVIGDRLLLRVLMENLLGNAWKFTGKREQAEIEFGAAKNGEKKAYFVKDNGAGFDMAYANKLFGAFQRLHDTTEFPGTGIGLATVQRIINRHGGSVWAEGTAEKGATFYFTLN
jgi:PAS domain S-box-containing protein